MRITVMDATCEMSVPPKGTIVLAQDQASSCPERAESLRQAGYLIWEAKDGAEALNLVREHAPAILLLGLWTPMLSGLEVLEKLSRIPESVGLKVIVLSPGNDSDSVLEGLALGIADFRTSDQTPTELISQIERLMALQALPDPLTRVGGPPQPG